MCVCVCCSRSVSGLSLCKLSRGRFVTTLNGRRSCTGSGTRFWIVTSTSSLVTYSYPSSWLHSASSSRWWVLDDGVSFSCTIRWHPSASTFISFTVDREIFTPGTFRVLNFCVFCFRHLASGKNFLTVYNYNLELTHLRFQNCAVLGLTCTSSFCFTWEEFVIWCSISDGILCKMLL